MLYHVFRTKLLYTNLTDLTSLIISDQSYNPYILLMGKIRLTSWYGEYPIIFKVSSMLGGWPDFWTINSITAKWSLHQNPSDWTSPHRSPCQAQQKVSLDGQLQTLPQTEVDPTEWNFLLEFWSSRDSKHDFWWGYMHKMYPPFFISPTEWVSSGPTL